MLSFLATPLALRNVQLLRSSHAIVVVVTKEEVEAGEIEENESEAAG